MERRTVLKPVSTEGCNYFSFVLCRAKPISVSPNVILYATLNRETQLTHAQIYELGLGDDLVRPSNHCDPECGGIFDLRRRVFLRGSIYYGNPSGKLIEIIDRKLDDIC